MVAKRYMIAVGGVSGLAFAVLPRAGAETASHTPDVSEVLGSRDAVPGDAP
jgi:hypothetical protein